MHLERQVVVEIGERDTILRSHWLPNDDLVDVVELVPVFISEIVCSYTGYHVNGKERKA